MKFVKLKSKIKNYAYGGDTESKGQSEYQGFTGSNYLEDDIERAKHGGSVGGFKRDTLPPVPFEIDSNNADSIQEITQDTAKKLKDSLNQYNQLQDNARKFFTDWSSKTRDEARQKYDPNTQEGWEQINKIMQEDSEKRDEYDKALFKPIINNAYQNLEKAIGDEYNTYKKTHKLSPEFKEIQNLFSPSYFKQRFNDFPEDINQQEEPVKRFADGGSVPPNTDISGEIAGEGVAPVIKNLIVDKKPENPDAIEPSMSPLDFLTPGMVATPVKTLGRGAAALAESEAAKDLGKSLVSKVKELPKIGREYADGFKFIGESANDVVRDLFPFIKKMEFNRDARLVANQAAKRSKEAAKVATENPFKAEFYENPVVYHGSPYGGIEEFIPSSSGMAGPGVYTTTNPELASDYATGKVKGIGNFVKSTFDKPNQTPTVYPLRVRGKIFDRENPQHVWDLAQHRDPTLPKIDFSGEWWKDPKKLEAYNSQVKKLGYLEDAVKDSGLYNGFKVDNNVIIFDPKNIRSIFAKFDPAMKDSANILAGLGAAGLTFDQLKELLNKKSTNKDGEL